MSSKYIDEEDNDKNDCLDWKYLCLCHVEIYDCWFDIYLWFWLSYLIIINNIAFSYKNIKY